MEQLLTQISLLKSKLDTLEPSVKEYEMTAKLINVKVDKVLAEVRKMKVKVPRK